MSDSAPAGCVLIHGKVYKTVSLRVSEMLKDHPEWAVTTDLLTEPKDPDEVAFKATVWDGGGRPKGTGHAQETWGDGDINKTSALENCETSAIGRALAACGYAGHEYASADEVQRAIERRSKMGGESPAKPGARSPGYGGGRNPQCPTCKDRDLFKFSEAERAKGKGHYYCKSTAGGCGAAFDVDLKPMQPKEAAERTPKGQFRDFARELALDAKEAGDLWTRFGDPATKADNSLDRAKCHAWALVNTTADNQCLTDETVDRLFVAHKTYAATVPELETTLKELDWRP